MMRPIILFLLFIASGFHTDEVQAWPSASLGNCETVNWSNSAIDCPSEGVANNMAQATAQARASARASGECAKFSRVVTGTRNGESAKKILWQIGASPSCSSYGEVIEAWYPVSQLCTHTAATSGSGQFNSALDNDIQCYGGCQRQLDQGETSYSWSSYQGKICTIDTFNASSCPAGWAYNPTFGTCNAPPPDADGDGVPDTLDVWPTDPTRTLDTDNDGIANEFDDFPTDPGETVDSDNDGEGDNSDFAPDDATNGQDQGTGNETDNTTSGGGNCETAPQSVGEPITAQIAYQTWKGRCAAEAQLAELKKITGTVTGDVTSCASAYTCTGGATQCAQVHLLRKQICGTSTGSTGATPVGDADSNGVADALETGLGDPTEIDIETVKDRGNGSEDFANSLDTGGFLGGGTCPGLPPILGSSAIGDLACSQGDILAALIQMFGLFFAAMIVGKSLSGA